MRYVVIMILALLLNSCGGGGSPSQPVLSSPPPEYIYTYNQDPNAKKVLILYDVAGPNGDMGKTNALLLQNLLGHFDLNITSKPVTQYVENDMTDQEVVFYIGNTFDVTSYYKNSPAEKKSYEDFYKDVALQNKIIVWMNYNLQLLEEAWHAHNWDNTTFTQKFGIHFKNVSNLKYNRVKYKDTELFKGVIPFATPGADISKCLSEGDHRYACASELNLLELTDPNKTEILATTYSTLDQNTSIDPYIVRSSKFWFVGDIPFTYMSEEDRYLAFSDLLHDMLEIYHEEEHKAIVRLEDIDARTNINDLNGVTDYLQKENIVFSLAVIPQYEDPFGVENNGVPTSRKLSDSVIGTALKKLSDAGHAYIVQHGYTHQFNAVKNPYNGVTADDFEFMRVVQNADNSYSYLYPTGEDSASWAQERIQRGKKILNDIGLQAFAWEAPHYMAGPNHYRAIREFYPIQYARLLYYPNEESDDKAKKYTFAGQFFPYVIKRDSYGYFIIPENIYNIEPQPNKGYRKLMPADTIRFAKKLKVVRDGVASFFYHPFLGTGYLEEIIQGLKALDYEFVAAPKLVEGLK